MAVANAGIDTDGMQTKAATRVFIVDDSALVRGLLIDMLAELEGVSVVGEAESSAEAIAGIVVTNPDAVVLDIHLRVGKGIDVLQELRRLTEKIIFIILTSYANSQYRKAYLAAGASYFLDKTTELAKIAEIIAAQGATRH